MNFEEALAAELSAISGLTEGSNKKVYLLNAPEGTKAPYIVCVSSNGLEDKCLTGYLNSKEISFELNVLHTRYGNMKSLAGLVLDKIKSFQGRAIGTDGPKVKDVTYEDPVEMYEDQIKLYRCVISAQVFI